MVLSGQFVMRLVDLRYECDLELVLARWFGGEDTTHGSEGDKFSDSPIAAQTV